MALVPVNSWKLVSVFALSISYNNATYNTMQFTTTLMQFTTKTIQVAITVIQYTVKTMQLPTTKKYKLLQQQYNLQQKPKP